MRAEGDFNRDRAELFEALGHPTRIRILQALSSAPLGFSELKREAGIESNGLMAFHLGKLEGLVKATPGGSYALTDDGREALRNIVANASPGNNGFAKKINRKKTTILAIALVFTIIVSGVLAWNGYTAARLNQLNAAVEYVRFDFARITDVALYQNTTTDRGSLEFAWEMFCNNPTDGRLHVDITHFEAEIPTNGTSFISISEGPIAYVCKGSVEPHSITLMSGLITMNTSLGRAVQLMDFFSSNGVNITRIIAYASFKTDFQYVSTERTLSTMEDDIYLYGVPHVIER